MNKNVQQTRVARTYKYIWIRNVGSACDVYANVHYVYRKTFNIIQVYPEPISGTEVVYVMLWGTCTIQTMSMQNLFK